MNEKCDDESGRRDERDSAISSSSSHGNDDVTCETPIENRSGIVKVSEELRKTASNVLTQVASRITSRTLPEPPPPPDGGLRAVSKYHDFTLLYVAHKESSHT
jgi:hypothetical protein